MRFRLPFRLKKLRLEATDSTRVDFSGPLDANATARRARSGRGVYDLVSERGLMTRDQLDRLLNPEAMTAPRATPATDR